MLPITNDVMAEISALQWLTPDQLKAEYGEYLSDAQNCQRVEILRSLVIYRLQEKFYGIKLPRAIVNTLDETVAGDRLLHAPADDLGKCVGKKLVRVALPKRRFWRCFVGNWLVPSPTAT